MAGLSYFPLGRLVLRRRPPAATAAACRRQVSHCCYNHCRSHRSRLRQNGVVSTLNVTKTSHCYCHSRWFSNQTKTFKIIPDPTWSIASLQLEQQHAPVTKLELQRLAKRAVISLPHLETKDSSSTATVSSVSNVQDELCQDLGNMLHMMNQVQDFVTSYAALHGDKYPFLNESKATNDDDDDATRAAILYDVPRGVTSAPLFRVDSNNNESNSTVIATDSSSNVDTDTDCDRDVATVDSVIAQDDKRDTYWSHHLHRVGGHEYFQIVTAVEVGLNDGARTSVHANSSSTDHGRRACSEREVD